jgi:hypothetical protein
VLSGDVNGCASFWSLEIDVVVEFVSFSNLCTSLMLPAISDSDGSTKYLKLSFKKTVL